ncbi:MAG: hypothetical protein IKA76_09565 [Clostridia bacterium]|nr:hypothetical protein [Clostridia bacterium]
MKKRMLTVPIAVHSADELPDYAKFLHKAGAKRVFLCCLPHWVEDDILVKEIEKHRHYAEYLGKEGFEVGLWLHAFGFGVPLTEPQKKICAKFRKIRDLRGREAGEAFCPTSEDFCHYMERLISLSASLPIRLLMLDDDFCQSVRPGIGCACDTHLSELRRLSGDLSLKLEDLNQKIFYDSNRTLRHLWFDLQAKTISDFARRMRAVVDQVNPDLRFGFCAGYTSWDFEGISAIDLTKILAGSTEPFLRTTGAPYWVSTNRHNLHLHLQDIVELTRMQREWGEDTGVEMFDENDNYPRITSLVPASLQEGFDMAMAVDGGLQPFKYLFPYVGGIHHEQFYINAHFRNADNVERLHLAAEGKHDIGVRVREYRDKARSYDYRPEDEGTFGAGKGQMCAVSYPRNHCIASHNAIPTVYGKASCEILFGENAKYIPLDALPMGSILDIRAAEILSERGVDVGLTSSVEYVKSGPYEQWNGIDISLWGTNRFGKAALADGVTVLSTVGENALPCSYRYENAKGNRFLVFCFDASSLDYSSSLFSHYARRQQLYAHLDWLGADVPFRMKGDYPNLYAMCKRGDDGSLLIALFNFTENPLYDITLSLADSLEGKTPLSLGCGISHDKRSIVIDSIPAFGFGAVEIVS